MAATTTRRLIVPALIAAVMLLRPELGAAQRPATSCSHSSAPAAQTAFALNEPMDLGYPARTIDRLHVRSLLEQRRFGALDTLFGALRDGVRRDSPCAALTRTVRFEHRSARSAVV